MKKGLFILFLLFSISVSAVEKYQLQLLLSPTFERYSPRNSIVMDYLRANGLASPKLSYNFGFEYKHYLDPYVSFSTGLIFQNKGYIAKNDSTVFNLSVYYLSLPTNFNFHSSINKRLDYYIQVGMSNGILLKDVIKVRNSRSEDENKINNPFTGSELADRSERLNIFSKRHTAINLGFGFEKFFKAKFVVEVNPVYTLQLNKAFSRNAAIYYGNLPVFYPRLDSFSLNFKVGYYFNKQIQIIKEDF